MKKNFVLQAVGMFILTALIAGLLLVGSVCIPQAAIKEQVVDSAEYFARKPLFPYLNGNQFNLRQDNYADSILVNIMYHMGAGSDENIFSTTMKAAYYNEERQNVNESLSIAVSRPHSANVPYFRYWHGSLILLRPLFMITDIAGARMVLGIAALFCILLTAFILWKKKQGALAVCFFLCYLLMNGFMGMFCIEYVMMLLLTGVISLILVLTDHENTTIEVRRQRVCLLMVISGALTCFFDFLTTETLTLTIPMFLEFALEQNVQQSFKQKFKQLFLCGFGWGAAYAGMFLLKWGISAALFGKEAFMEALSSASSRISGTVYLGDNNLSAKANIGERFAGAFGRNISALFPFKNEMNLTAGVLLFVFIIFISFSIIYLLRTKDFSFAQVGIYLILGCLPYLRYLVLSNHSYMHYFFTYRAQMVTVLAILYLTWEYGLKNLRKK